MSRIRSVWKRWFSWITISRWLIALCLWATSTQVTYATLDSLSFVGWINVGVLSLCALALLVRVFVPTAVITDYRLLRHSLLASDAVAITFICWGVFTNINGVLDSSEPEKQSAIVVEIIEEPLSLGWFHPAGRAALATRNAPSDLHYVALRNNAFANLLVGQELTFTQYNGLLGLPWITDVFINHEAVPRDLLTSEDPIVRKDIALALLHGKEWNEGQEAVRYYYEHYYEMASPEDDRFIHNVTDIFLKGNETHRAAAFLKSLIPIRPSYELYLSYGTILQQIGDRGGAIESYRAATGLHPQPILALYSLGYTLKAAGQFEEATAAFNRLLELAPQYSTVNEALSEMRQKRASVSPVS